MRRTKWYKEINPGGYIFTAKFSYLYLNLEHIYIVFMLQILYHFVRIIHAVLTHIILFWTVQKWLRYLRCTMPAQCWLSTYNKNQPFLQKKMCYTYSSQVFVNIYWIILQLFIYISLTTNPSNPDKPVPRVRVFPGLWSANPHPYPTHPYPWPMTGHRTHDNP